MRRLPPKPVRRLVLAPLVAALDLAILVVSPLLLLVAIILGPLLGGTRPARAVLIVVIFAARHLEALLALLALWLRRLPDDRARDEHYRVMRRFVTAVVGSIMRIARVEALHVDSDAALRALKGDRPVVLLSRHAGEGDTLLVIHELLCRHDRRPRVVMHEALRLDPLIDTLGTRVPNRFVDPRGGDTEVEIAALAGDLDARSALVIFPEGANFTPERRRRAIERLARRGHARQAAAAEAMQHVSAPRPGGALAAIEAAEAPDVVVMGHVGFPAGLGEVWRLLPKRQTIEIKLWHEPAEAIPGGEQERIDWLFDRWRRLDDWVREREDPT
ncbi:MAG TPA: 1-acyl-sn-glycerol-3-phosphate acyltransferase [Solirubrobacteraceae bacterium]|nr:1-acyl-sn-glycerol-3-phosphate acyltransferase [Solirubrobacteraceae bacterium]